MLREYVWLDDTPVAMIDSTGTSPATDFIHTGQIEEPLVMTDATQAKVWDAYVEPFGQAQVFGTPSAGLDLRLPGQFTEAESGGLNQNWNRNYDTSLGRYIEADPLGVGAGQNVYGYVDGDPLGASDPHGLQAQGLLGCAAGPEGCAAGLGIAALISYFAIQAVKNDAEAPPVPAASLPTTARSCPNNKCPPCRTVSGRTVAVGTIGYRFDARPPGSTQHGIEGDHLNLYQANQNPNNCQCFWRPLKAAKPPPLPHWIPVEPFARS